MTTAMMTMRLPPAICGVGDYTWQLWKHWDDTPPPWRFVVLDSAEDTGKLPEEPEVRQTVPSAGAVRTALDGVDTLGLMYTPYGYDRSGAPAWLADGLERWKEDGRKLVVMFHEGFVKSPPWTRSFWKAGGQKKIITRIGQLADAALTSTPEFQRKLDECEVQARLCPVPSNIPQVDRAERHGEKLRVVSFGMPQSRRKALQRHQHLIEVLQQQDRLQELVIVGAPSDHAEGTFVHADKLKFTGEVKAHACAEILANGDLFLCAHPPVELRKSGAASAALANACPVAVRGPELPGNPPALCYEEAEPAAERISRETLDSLGEAGRAWYESNASWDVCVRIWKEMLA